MEQYFDYVEHLSLPRLHAYLSIKNGIVFDEFSLDNQTGLGGLARECLCLGGILVNKSDINNDSFKRSYGENCPAFYAFDEETIYRQILRIVNMNDNHRTEIRKKAKEWAYKHLHWENRIDDYIDVLKRIKDKDHRL